VVAVTNNINDTASLPAQLVSDAPAPLASQAALAAAVLQADDAEGSYLAIDDEWNASVEMLAREYEASRSR